MFAISIITTFNFFRREKKRKRVSEKQRNRETKKQKSRETKKNREMKDRKERILYTSLYLYFVCEIGLKEIIQKIEKQ